MINFLLRLWTAIELLIWLKNLRDKEANCEDDVQQKRGDDRVYDSDRPEGSNVLDDTQAEKKRPKNYH